MDLRLIKEEPFGFESPNLIKSIKNGPDLLPSGGGDVIDISSGDVIDISSSDDDDDNDTSSKKKQKLEKGGEGTTGEVGGEFVLPVGFLDPFTPLPPVVDAVNEPSEPAVPHQQKANDAAAAAENVNVASVNYKQFWKAGDYEGAPSGDCDSISVGMDHVRVHPRFLHSNATSHKWALGAFAELLDNALDEICTGATYANIDMLQSKKDGNKMLLIEDNGGGMDPEKMRQCMSLGYSVKSKIANTIGQYGNGFKTSTMRLGADVIVFSRSRGKDGKRPTQSIGLLSYTFLRSTGKEDIIVPMLDYGRGGGEWSKIIRSNLADWNRNVQTIVQWSPFADEADLLRQFNLMKDHGTRIIIYNLWDDDQGMLELDFETDKHDILLRGVNRDEKNIQMAKEYPNSRHFLTYRHSLRSYASILYLRLAAGFRVILRGKDVEHHNIVNDMMLTQEVTYRPQPGPEGVRKDSNMLAVVTMGFVKDAKHHIDVQGFNVYHKNRLIKPFWRLWNAAGSDGRGVIGVLEANFVEPAHDKQGFERTTVLSRLETKLIQMQKTYWTTYCHKIGYAPRGRNRNPDGSLRESTPDFTPQTSPRHKSKGIPSSSQTPNTDSDKFYRNTNQEHEVNFEKTGRTSAVKYGNGNSSSKSRSGYKTPSKFGNVTSLSDSSSDDEYRASRREKKRMHGSNQKQIPVKNFYEKNDTIQPSQGYDSYSYTIEQLRDENRELKERFVKNELSVSKEVIIELEMEKERCKSLETQLEELKGKIEDITREQLSLLDIYSQERSRHDNEEEILRKKLKVSIKICCISDLHPMYCISVFQTNRRQIFKLVSSI